MVEAPLAVCVGLKLPQEFAGAQVQSTPALELSPETVSVMVAVAPTLSEAGLPLIVPVMVGGGVTVLLEPPPQPMRRPESRKRTANTLVLMRMKDHPLLLWRSIASR